MAASPTLTFDLATPRRPSLDDIGGAVATDHASKPPTKGTMPYADAWNQMQRLCERLSAMSPVCGLSVTFSAGVPSVAQFTSMRTSVLIGAFTVTDNGTGDTTITWPANTFPTSTLGPIVGLNDGHGTVFAVLVANGVRVLSKNVANVSTDFNFTVEVR